VKFHDPISDGCRKTVHHCKISDAVSRNHILHTAHKIINFVTAAGSVQITRRRVINMSLQRESLEPGGVKDK
jgi:hypothetical protein